jgi:hypothetical protein
MFYCEDEALFFQSEIPLDRVEPELGLDSEPVCQDRTVVVVFPPIPCVRSWRPALVDSRRLPPARAPPRVIDSLSPLKAASWLAPARPFASSG